MPKLAFIYASSDVGRVAALADTLRAIGYDVPDQPSSAEDVEASDASIVFWSPYSIHALNLVALADLASGANKLINVRVGPVDPPAAYAFVSQFDLAGWAGSASAFEVRALIARLAKLAPLSPSAPFFARRGEARRAQAAQAWAQISESRAVADFERYLEQFGDEPAYAERARYRMRLLAETSPFDRPMRASRAGRTAAGATSARIAMGAVAVTVMAGAGLAAFRFDKGAGESDGATAKAPDQPTIETANASNPGSRRAGPAIEVAAPQSAEAAAAAVRAALEPAQPIAPTVVAQAPARAIPTAAPLAEPLAAEPAPVARAEPAAPATTEAQARRPNRERSRSQELAASIEALRASLAASAKRDQARAEAIDRGWTASIPSDFASLHALDEDEPAAAEEAVASVLTLAPIDAPLTPVQMDLVPLEEAVDAGFEGRRALNPVYAASPLHTRAFRHASFTPAQE